MAKEIRIIIIALVLLSSTLFCFGYDELLTQSWEQEFGTDITIALQAGHRSTPTEQKEFLDILKDTNRLKLFLSGDEGRIKEHFFGPEEKKINSIRPVTTAIEEFISKISNSDMNKQNITEFVSIDSKNLNRLLLSNGTKEEELQRYTLDFIPPVAVTVGSGGPPPAPDTPFIFDFRPLALDGDSIDEYRELNKRHSAPEFTFTVRFGNDLFDETISGSCGDMDISEAIKTLRALDADASENENIYCAHVVLYKTVQREALLKMQKKLAEELIRLYILEEKEGDYPYTYFYLFLREILGIKDSTFVVEFQS